MNSLMLRSPSLPVQDTSSVSLRLATLSFRKERVKRSSYRSVLIFSFRKEKVASLSETDEVDLRNISELSITAYEFNETGIDSCIHRQGFSLMKPGRGTRFLLRLWYTIRVL